MGGRRVCLLLRGFNDRSGLRDLLLVSSCILGDGHYNFFFFSFFNKFAKYPSFLAVRFIPRPT